MPVPVAVPVADDDVDGIGNFCDACFGTPDVDADMDGRCNSSDNCVNLANFTQDNMDGDALGDLCDTCPSDANNDSDADGLCSGPLFSAPKVGGNDNCPVVCNASQRNTDGDACGDRCDNDCNGNGFLESDATDSDLDGTRNVCEPSVADRTNPAVPADGCAYVLGSPRACP